MQEISLPFFFFLSVVPHALSPVIRVSRSPLFATQVQENKAPEEVRAAADNND